MTDEQAVNPYADRLPDRLVDHAEWQRLDPLMLLVHPIREVDREHRDELEHIGDQRARWDRLVELNVIRQVKNVAADVFVQDAWARGQALSVHGWVYSIANGLVNDLDVTVSGADEADALP